MDWKVSFLVISILGFITTCVVRLFVFKIMDDLKESFEKPDHNDFIFWFAMFTKYFYEPFIYFIMIIFIIIPKVNI